MVWRIVVVLTFGLALTACQAPAPMEPLPASRFNGHVEPLTQPIVVRPGTFPASPFQSEYTLTARDLSTGESARLSQKIFRTVEGVRSGSNVVITTTIDRFEGDNSNQPTLYEPGTKIRAVYAADGRPQDITFWGPGGDSIQETVGAKLLQDTFHLRIGGLRIATGYRFRIAEYAFPGFPGQTIQTNGVVRGKGIFKNRHVAVIDLEGSITGGPATTNLSGFFLVDLETGMTVYSDWRTLTPIQEGRRQAHFREESELSLPPTIASVGSDSAAQDPVTGDTELRPIAIRWEGVAELIAGTMSLQQRSGGGEMSVTLPNNAGTCQGTYRIGSDRLGTWAVACTNNLAASGNFTAFGGDKGSAGEGTDSKGRRVQFTVGGR